MERKRLFTLGCLLACALATPAPAAWTLSDSFQASDKNADGDDSFGIDVGLAGDLAIIGAPKGHNASGVETGAAYLFNINNPFNVGGEFKLVGSDTAAGDFFGDSVSVGSGYAVVGARRHNSDAGATYIFNAATGEQLHKITVPSSTFFGNDVAASSSGSALIGNYLNDTVYLYSASSGSPQAGFAATSTVSGDKFGWSVATSGNTAIVGALDDDGLGSAFLFDITDPTSPVELGKLQPTGLTSGGRFGEDVAIAGSVAVVGSRAGRAYLFDIANPSVPRLIATLDEDAPISGAYGFKVATDGQFVLISDDRAGESAGTGTVWVYDAADGSFLETLVPDDGVANDRFGKSLAIQSGKTLVGAWGFDNPASTSGKAYLYNIPEPASLILIGAGAPLLLRRKS